MVDSVFIDETSALVNVEICVSVIEFQDMAISFLKSPLNFEVDDF